MLRLSPLLLALAGCVAAPEPEGGLTVDDVLRMNAAGVAPDVVVAHIRAQGVREPLGTERVIALSREKVDARVLEALVVAASGIQACPYCETWAGP